VIDVPVVFRDAMRYSRATTAEMDIVIGGVVVENDVPLVSGSVSTDRGRNTRYEASADMGMYPWDDLPVDAYGTRVRLRYGLTSVGWSQTIQVGEYLVNDFKRTNRGSIGLTLKGLEQYVIEAEFVQPRQPASGSSTVATIAQLIREIPPLSAVEIVVLNSYDRRIGVRSPWEKDRWGAITSLADSISAEVFAGPDGRFYIVDRPTLTALSPVYRIDGGPAGVMIEESRSRTRDQVYNAVSVSGQSSDTSVPPVWGWARDTDPNSPTYFYGRYGQRVRFYSSQFFTSAAQCRAYALDLLTESLIPHEQLSVGATPIPFLEAGDAVEVASEQEGGTVKPYLLQSTKLPLGTGSWSADVQSEKAADEVGEAA
jgi:hypothetical protein